MHYFEIFVEAVAKIKVGIPDDAVENFLLASAAFVKNVTEKKLSTFLIDFQFALSPSHTPRMLDLSIVESQLAITAAELNWTLE